MKIIPNARRAWRWFSVQAMAAALAIEAAWANLPLDLKGSIPESAVTYGTMALLALGIIGRLVQQEPQG